MHTIQCPFNTAFREGAVLNGTEAPVPFKALRIESHKNNILEMHIQEIAGIQDVALKAITKPGKATSFKYNERFTELETALPQVAHVLAATFELAVRKSDINPKTFIKNGIYFT